MARKRKNDKPIKRNIPVTARLGSGGASGDIPEQYPPPTPEHIRFSFKYADLKHPRFGTSSCGRGYTQNLLERLRAICGMRPVDFLTNRSSSLRSHPIDWERTTESDGFGERLPKQLRDLPPYQFSVSSNAHGRIHGVLHSDVFYIVWVDPNHNLYA